MQVRYDYDVLGKITAIKNGSNQAITDASSLAYLNPLRYRGYVFDDETGLYYLRSRYYDPVTGLNCMQMSVNALKQGKYYSYDLLFDSYLTSISTLSSPNAAYNMLKYYHFHKKEYIV